MCRFYGRIADSADNHCQDTIDAIRDNVQGILSKIKSKWVLYDKQKWSKSKVAKHKKLFVGKVSYRADILV